jgi:hypothetical protein
MMTTKFLNALEQNVNYAYTENSALARATTNSALLDFFSQGGAIRSLSPEDQQTMFLRAWNENPLLALKAMFYFRDVRGGQGQRDAFRNQLKLLAELAPETVIKNLDNIPEYGRWDDLYALDGTEVEDNAYSLFVKQFREDIRGLDSDENISLLAKWLKSENASSKETKRLARKTREALEMDSRNYRKTLSALRKYLDVVERKVSANQWEDIKYSAVPSNAMMKYRNAFMRHDGTRFGDYIRKVDAGEEKINASVLYPHEIVGKVMPEHWGYNKEARLDPKLADTMWNNLFDFMGITENAIGVIDTSGSMYGLPIQVAIALGILLAERAVGPYKDHFITFSSAPKLQKITGNDITSKVRGLFNADWDCNTDIEAVFDLILNTAIKNKLSQEDMIDKLYIISDMEFDAAAGTGYYNPYNENTPAVGETLFQTIRRKFEKHGYRMPNLVFWNVDARNPQFPMSMDERGFQNVSGFSPSILRSLMSGEFVGPYDIMLEVLESDRYDPIVI